MIKSYSIQKPFEFRGVSYRNLQHFRDQLTEIEKHPDPYYRILTDNNQTLFLERDELYPCFDSSDRMYENRYYHYLFYCKNREKLDEKFNYLNGINYLSSSAQSDRKLIPNIFYGDDTLFFQIAE
jgi:hypothetical protein